MEPLLRFIRTSGLAGSALVSAAAVASPRFVYATSATGLGMVLPADKPPQFASVDIILLLIGASFGVLFAFDAIACAAAIRRFETHDDAPLILRCGYIVALLTPAWLPPLETAFGPVARVLAFAAWPLIFLSFLTFVVAGARIEADAHGENPGLAMLTAFYHLGGWCGAGLAKQVFPTAKICERFPTGMPAVMPYLAVAAVAWWVLRDLAPSTQAVLPVLGIR